MNEMNCLLLNTRAGKTKEERKKEKEKGNEACGSDLKKEKLTCKSCDDKFVVVTKLHVH
jgi:hypothetical protein